MILEKEQSVELSIQVWTFCMKTGKEKCDWPEWNKYSKIEADCFCCEYASQKDGGFANGCSKCPLVTELGQRCYSLGYGEWISTGNIERRKVYAAEFLTNIKKCLQKIKENKMTRKIEISEETYQALKSQIVELEKPKEKKLYPIATVNHDRCNYRLILNLPAETLAEDYKNSLLSISLKGVLVNQDSKSIEFGTFYRTGDNVVVFPPKE